jgi:hypothetical protein
MDATLDLEQMTVPDKLRLMEALWQSLTTCGQEIPSPAWHGAVLAERDCMLESGDDAFIAWESAKEELRQTLP